MEKDALIAELVPPPDAPESRLRMHQSHRTQKIEMSICELCHREVAETTKHHLTPREFDGEVVVYLCGPCHRHVHAVFKNKTLAGTLHSIDALRQTKEIKKWVRFIRKQPDRKIKRSVRSKRRR